MSDVKVASLTWAGGRIVRVPQFIPVKKRLADIMLKKAAKTKEPQHILEQDLAKWKGFFHEKIGQPRKVSKSEGEKAVEESKETEKDSPVVEPDPIMEDVTAPVDDTFPNEETTLTPDLAVDETPEFKELMKKAKPELRKLAGEQGLETEGTKEDLANRILNFK